MVITVNGKAYDFKEKISIDQLLKQLEIPQSHGIAVALNYAVVSRDKLESTYLQDGDCLDIIHATAGG